VELDAFEPFVNHARDGIRAAATYAHHLMRALPALFLKLVLPAGQNTSSSAIVTAPFLTRYLNMRASKPTDWRSSSPCTFNFAEYIARPAAAAHPGWSVPAASPQSQPADRSSPAAQGAFGHIAHAGQALRAAAPVSTTPPTSDRSMPTRTSSRRT
jgi:hypothetical protein